MIAYETLRHSAALRPHHPAVVDAERSLSFAQLRERANRLANALGAHGAGPGQRVGVLSHNRSELVEMLFAAALGGWACVPINYRLAPAEAAEIAADAELCALVAEPELAELAVAVRDGGFEGPLIWLGEPETGAAAEGASYERLLAGASPVPPPGEPSPDAVLLQMYTSGTTGRPKGVMLSQANLMANSWTHQAERSVVASDRYLTTAPLCHLAAASRMLTLVHAGATHVIERSFDPQRVIAAVASGEANSTLVVPAMVRDLLDAAAASPDPVAGKIRLLTYGASPMPQDLLGEALAALACDFQQGYGLTESSPTLTLLSPEDHLPLAGGGYRPQIASVGREALGVHVRVVDAEDRDVAVGAVGEVIARGPNVMRGYWRQPEQTEAALRGGWLRTGDLAQLDGQGYLYLVDRIKDMLVCGGINVYPREIERQLERHPAIADVAVVGMADERFGEVPVAFVVGRPGADVALGEPELTAFLEPRLARFKRPRRYELVERLPRNAAGKVIKGELRDRIAAAMSS